MRRYQFAVEDPKAEAEQFAKHIYEVTKQTPLTVHFPNYSRVIDGGLAVVFIKCMIIKSNVA